MAKTKYKIATTNKKTGPITATSRTQDSCPNACPFKGSGCYAEYGPGGGVFRQTEKLGRDDELTVINEMVARVPVGDGVRWNVSGDLTLSDGETLDRDYVEAIDAFHSTRPDTWPILYSHAWRGQVMPFERVNANASCETLDEVAQARALGWQTVMTVPTTDDIPEGREFVRCPAEYRTVNGKPVNCSTCKLCSKARSTTVVFTVHGTGKRKAASAINAKEQRS